MADWTFLDDRGAIESAWQAFRALFRNRRLSDEPVRIPGTGVILGDFPLDMPDEQYAAIADAATAEGDIHAYVSYVGYCDPRNDDTMPDDFAAGKHFKTQLTWNPILPAYRLESFLEFQLRLLEYVIYSPSGSWGVMTSLDLYAIAVGSDQFRARLTSSPWFAGALQRFLEQCKHWRDDYREDTGWMPTLLENVYGADAARQILSEFGEPRERWDGGHRGGPSSR